jgi:hypothetical protein
LVGETLANDALELIVGTVAVVIAERDAGAVAKIKLRQIAVQVVLVAV